MSLVLALALSPFVFLAGAFLKGDSGYYDLYSDHSRTPNQF